MPIGKFFTGIAVVVVLLATIFSALGLIHELTSGLPPHELIHELETWAAEAGYRLALIILAAAGVAYLANKK